jgi:hypothetical protein
MAADENLPAKIGRPSDYRVEYCDRVIELGMQGASVIAMATDIGVSRNTLELNWPAAHPEFREALEMARQHSQVWWERAGQIGMITQGFQGSVWIRSMSARFPKDWREPVKGDAPPAPNADEISKVDVSELSVDEQRVLAKVRLRKEGEGAGKPH